MCKDLFGHWIKMLVSGEFKKFLPRFTEKPKIVPTL